MWDNGICCRTRKTGGRAFGDVHPTRADDWGATDLGCKKTRRYWFAAGDRVKKESTDGRPSEPAKMWRDGRASEAAFREPCLPAAPGGGRGECVCVPDGRRGVDARSARPDPDRGTYRCKYAGTGSFRRADRKSVRGAESGFPDDEPRYLERAARLDVDRRGCTGRVLPRRYRP